MLRCCTKNDDCETKGISLSPELSSPLPFPTVVQSTELICKHDEADTSSQRISFSETLIIIYLGAFPHHNINHHPIVQPTSQHLHAQRALCLRASLLVFQFRDSDICDGPLSLLVHHAVGKRRAESENDAIETVSS